MISERNIIKTKLLTQSKAKAFIQQYCKLRRKPKEHHLNIQKKRNSRNFVQGRPNNKIKESFHNYTQREK